MLEPDEQLASATLTALGEVAPEAIVDLARSLEEAQRVALETKPDLFVLDVDATYDLGQEFLYDLRTSHPNARAIILTAIHLTAARERAAGLGAIHFLEKPFPHDDFVALVGALLHPPSKDESEKFQGTLSDLHIADIIQLKCMSGTTAAIEFTGPRGEKARVFFENGQVRHATAPGKEGMAAFNEIVTWKGGKISEIAADSNARTIDLDWQVLLMEAIRKVDEAGAAPRDERFQAKSSSKRKVLVIDDSLMLLSFVKDILTDSNYEVATAATAAESLSAAKSDPPDLILLDYVLPDMKGDEVSRKLSDDPATAKIPVVYMSGFGIDLRKESIGQGNVIGFLNKPFTSDLLIKTVETHMPKPPDESQPVASDVERVPVDVDAAEAEAPQPEFVTQKETVEPETVQGEEPAAEAGEWWSAPQAQADWPQSQPIASTPDVDVTGADELSSTGVIEAQIDESNLPDESVTGGAYFCGDTSFFSLNWALQAIAKEKLTGSLRSFWNKEPVDLLAQNGRIVLATTRDPELYCPEAPITLVNVDAERIATARGLQRETGCPMFLTLAQEDLILREPALQLVQHYGQKLFAQLWTARRVRFVFEQNPALPEYASNVPADPEVDNWTLTTLRFIQFQDLKDDADYDAASIPAFTKDGFDRVQKLRLTVAEAQFASQFNGSRSIQQLAKNLRLDVKFARLTLFRFLALEIVECWPPTAATKPERKGVLGRLTRSIGIGE
ncbi:MAG: response regulator [Verrucomicrobiota bacterium]|nr:response regulator [Verrucomicrobiota bacterium]